MANESATRDMLQQLFRSTGMELSDQDLDIVSKLHDGFASQRARLSIAARPESEPMIIPAFDHSVNETEATDEHNS